MFTEVGKSVQTQYMQGTDDAYAGVNVVFGIKGVARGNFNQYVPSENRGEAVFDHAFNLAAPACQRVVVSACEDIQTLACDSNACKPLATMARSNTTRCFMTEFRDWAGKWIRNASSVWTVLYG
jgi:hypothetical protein